MCNNCKTAQEFRNHSMFDPACIFCGARLIQRIGKLPIAQSEAVLRRRAVLKDWVDWGHSEAKIRQLAKGPTAFSPDSTGPVKAPACADPKTARRR